MTVNIISNTRTNIVNLAKRLFKTRSYLGFSFQDIADEIGLRKASLHYHFPSKESLGIEVLHELLVGFQLWCETTPASAEEQIDAYFELLRNTVQVGMEVCPAGGLTPGWACLSDEMRNAVRELRSAHVLWLTGVIGALKRKNPNASASDLASYVFSACQGGLLSARMTGRASDFDLLITQVRRSLFK